MLGCAKDGHCLYYFAICVRNVFSGIVIVRTFAVIWPALQFSLPCDQPNDQYDFGCSYFFRVSSGRSSAKCLPTNNSFLP